MNLAKTFCGEIERTKSAVEKKKDELERAKRDYWERGSKCVVTINQRRWWSPFDDYIRFNLFPATSEDVDSGLVEVEITGRAGRFPVREISMSEKGKFSLTIEGCRYVGTLCLEGPNITEKVGKLCTVATNHRHDCCAFAS